MECEFPPMCSHASTLNAQAPNEVAQNIYQTCRCLVRSSSLPHTVLLHKPRVHFLNTYRDEALRRHPFRCMQPPLCAGVCCAFGVLHGQPRRHGRSDVPDHQGLLRRHARAFHHELLGKRLDLSRRCWTRQWYQPRSLRQMLWRSRCRQPQLGLNTCVQHRPSDFGHVVSSSSCASKGDALRMRPRYLYVSQSDQEYSAGQPI